MKSFRFARIASTLVLGMLMQACALPRLEPVPSTLTESAVIPGIPNARYWVDRDLGPFVGQVLQDLERENEAQHEISAYVIRNGRLQPEWSGTRRRTLSIGGRAISALIQTQGINDVDRIYRTAQQDGVDFNLAYIGSDFNYPHNENFDTEYMKRLFDYAYRLSANGYPWHKTPPGEASLEPE